MSRLGLRPFLCDSGGLFVLHFRMFSDIHTRYRGAELDRDVVGIKGVDGVNKDVVENKGTLNRHTLVFFKGLIHVRPFEKGNHVVFGYLEKIVPVSGAAKTSHQAHAEQIPPEADSRVHVSGGHCQVIDSSVFCRVTFLPRGLWDHIYINTTVGKIDRPSDFIMLGISVKSK